MSHVARLEGIRELLKSYPGVSNSTVRNTEYAERHVAPKGMPIVLEPRGTKHNNVWVRADSLDATALSDLTSKYHPNASAGKHKPNHDLYSDPLLTNVDLICYKVKSVAEAKVAYPAVPGRCPRSL